MTQELFNMAAKHKRCRILLRSSYHSELLGRFRQASQEANNLECIEGAAFLILRINSYNLKDSIIQSLIQFLSERENSPQTMVAASKVVCSLEILLKLSLKKIIN